MNQWLPVIATLSGAIVAGAVAVLVHWLTNRRSTQHLKLTLAEERARWAIDKQLDRLQRFYMHLEELISATEAFRINRAWGASTAVDGAKVPDWVPKDDDARENFEKMLRQMTSELVFMDEVVQEKYQLAKAGYFKWFTSKTLDDGVTELRQMENDLYEFRDWMGAFYRKTFDARRQGLDY